MGAAALLLALQANVTGPEPAGLPGCPGATLQAAAPDAHRAWDAWAIHDLSVGGEEVVGKAALPQYLVLGAFFARSALRKRSSDAHRSLRSSHLACRRGAGGGAAAGAGWHHRGAGWCVCAASCAACSALTRHRCRRCGWRRCYCGAGSRARRRAAHLLLVGRPRGAAAAAAACPRRRLAACHAGRAARTRARAARFVRRRTRRRQRRRWAQSAARGGRCAPRGGVDGV